MKATDSRTKPYHTIPCQAKPAMPWLDETRRASARAGVGGGAMAVWVCGGSGPERKLQVGRLGRSTRDWGCPAGGTYQGAFAHPPRALLHVPPQSGSPSCGKGAVAASSTLQRVLPREVTHVRPKSYISHLRGMIRGGGSHRTSSSTSGFWGPGAGSQAKSPVLQAPPPGLVFSRREGT